MLAASILTPFPCHQTGNPALVSGANIAPRPFRLISDPLPFAVATTSERPPPLHQDRPCGLVV